MEAPLLSLRGVGFRRGERWALRGVSLDVRPGEAWGVVGESGAGKTTLLNLALGLLEPHEGELLLKGRPWSGLPETRRRPRRASIQAVFQDPLASLPPHRTGWEILEEPLVIHRRGNARERRAAAARMAARVRFPEGALEQLPARWSGGLAQRLSLARALMLGPELLVLDEPLSALDPTLAGHLLGLLLELKAEGTALLFVSHDLDAVERLCDRMAVLYGGEPLCQGDTAPLLAELRHPYLRALREASPRLGEERLPAPWGAEPGGAVAPGACVLHGRCPRTGPRCLAAPAFGLELRCHHPFGR